MLYSLPEGILLVNPPYVQTCNGTGCHNQCLSNAFLEVLTAVNIGPTAEIQDGTPVKTGVFPTFSCRIWYLPIFLPGKGKIYPGVDGFVLKWV